MPKRRRHTRGARFSFSEKRLSPRRRFRTKIILEDERKEGFIYFYSSDISAGGIHLESDIPFRVGTKVFLHFHLDPDLPMVRATGEVARLEKEIGPPSSRGSFVVMGMGIRFIDLDLKGEAALKTFLSRP